MKWERCSWVCSFVTVEQRNLTEFSSEQCLQLEEMTVIFRRYFLATENIFIH